MVGNSTSTKATSKKPRVGKLPFVLIGIGMLFPFMGKILFLGPFLVFLAPDFLLIGISLLIVKVFVSPEKVKARIAVFIPVCLVFGLNTRIPSIAHDLLFSTAESNVARKLSLSIGDSIHLDSNALELSARRFPYTGSHPQCMEGICAIITGFFPPATFLGIDYWREDPTQSIKSFGYSIANPGQKAPTLKIRTREEGHALKIKLELLDDRGIRVSDESRTYRNGFPFESPDLDGRRRNSQPFLWAVEFMLHGNMVSSFVGRRFGHSQVSPAGQFLNYAIQRYVQQDDPKLTQLIELVVEKDVETSPSASDEAWVSDQIWNATFFDQVRSNACKTVVQPEINNIDVPDFTVDGGIRGMAKARSPLKFLSGKNGNERLLVRMGDVTLCDGGYLYLLARTNNYSQYEISKYKYDGTFIYRAAFKMPRSASGLTGVISPTSLLDENDSLTFEYVDLVNHGRTRSINRIRSMRISLNQIDKG